MGESHKLIAGSYGCIELPFESLLMSLDWEIRRHCPPGVMKVYVNNVGALGTLEEMYIVRLRLVPD